MFRDLALGENCHTKTLGLGWLHTSDKLFFTTKCNQNGTHATKRIILSTISQIYDPLGLLSPVTIIVKILLQKLWLAKIGWDDPVPHNILMEWQFFLERLSYLKDLQFPRYVKCDNAQQTEHSNSAIVVRESQSSFNKTGS